MKKIILICAFFGKLPENRFQITLDTCAKNTTINWLLITDDTTEFNYPKNVQVCYMSFEKLKKLINFKLNVKLDLKVETKLDDPYKLCDYRPLFGVIFENYISDFDFWGYSDLTDVLYGDIRKFIPNELLDKNDKINYLGHFTLFRNNPEVNTRFKIEFNDGLNLKKILGSNESFAFDELGKHSITQIYFENKFKAAHVDNFCADISPMRFAFQLSKYDEKLVQYYEPKKPMVITWRNGNLLAQSVEKNKIVSSELGYVHFQKREVINKLSGTSQKSAFIFTPYGILDYPECVDTKFVKKMSHDRFYIPFFKLKFKAMKVRINNLIN